MRANASLEDVARLGPVTRDDYTLLVYDTQDFTLLRANHWLTVHCTDDYVPRLRHHDKKSVGEKDVLRRLHELGLQGGTFIECCPCIMGSMRVTRLRGADGARVTLASWLRGLHHGMWATTKSGDLTATPVMCKYAANMHDVFPDSYKAAFTSTGDFTRIIRDPNHALCRYHALKTYADGSQ